MVLVTRPEPSAFTEAARTSAELAALGVRNQRLVINAVFETRGDDPVAVALERRGKQALEAIPARAARLATHCRYRYAPEHSWVSTRSGAWTRSVTAPDPVAYVPVAAPGLDVLIDALAATPRGVVLTMGKGGVGKTTLAAAIAVDLARRGLRVHLSTTDPAAHVADAVGVPPPGLTVSRIDPIAETRAYTAEVLGSVGPQLDDKGRALLEEDLRSPCTEEVAVFRAFARTVAEGEDRIVVLDTAPTGHTILLLDAAESYHREVLRQGSRMPDSVRQLLPRLARSGVHARAARDAARGHASARGSCAARRPGPRRHRAFRVGGEPEPRTGTTRDPVLCARRAAERPYIEEVRLALQRMAVVRWAPEPPRGIDGLAALAHPRRNPPRSPAVKQEVVMAITSTTFCSCAPATRPGASWRRSC